MKANEIKVGMEVNVKGFFNKSFHIIEVSNETATIRGMFSEKITIPQIINVPVSDLIDGSFDGKMFTLKDCPSYNEKILVSDDGNEWYIRCFDSFSQSVVGGVYTTLQSNDKKMMFDEDGHSVGEVVKWNMYKRFNFID